MKRTFFLLLIALAGLCMVPARPVSANPVPEYTMKAAFLYNFTLFTDWPAVSGGSLKLCLLGKDPFGAALDAFEGKQVNGMRLVIARLGNTRDIKSCHVLYLGESTSREVVQELADTPILTVTDVDSLVQTGVMISMSLENNRVTFQVNLEAARRAHLAISSKLLRLAKTVY